MNKEQIFSKVKEIIADKNSIEISEIKDDSNLQTDLGLDSLDRVELTMTVEKEFGITISDDDAQEAITPNDYVALVEKAEK